MKQKIHILLMGALVAITGCDTFFGMRTLVTDAVTGQPVAGATAKLVLDKGVAEPDLVTTTGTNGVLNLWMNEHSSAWATLTVQKPGYETWSTQFRGRPRPGFVIRLEPKDQKGPNPTSDGIRQPADGPPKPSM